MANVMAIFLGIQISILPQAKADPFAVKINPPGEVQLVSYVKCSKTFEIELIGEEGADYFYVSPEEILKSIPSVSGELLKKTPKAVLNKVYKLERPIYFHPTPFLEERKKKFCR